MTKLSVSTSFKQYLLANRGSLVNHWLLQFTEGIAIEHCTFEVDYLTERTDGIISYLPKGKEHKVTEDGKWSREGRQTGKAARVIRKLFSPELLAQLKDSDFEAFSNIYKANAVADNSGFRITDKPSKIYAMYVNEERDGSLAGSCMNGDTHLLEIYDDGFNIACVYLLDENDDLIGRALLWKDINIEVDGEWTTGTFMDRIYTYQDHDIQKFQFFARSKGWWSREYQRHEHKRNWISPDGEFLKVRAEVDTPALFDYDGKMPYIDTFTYVGDDVLSNYTDHPQVYAQAIHTGGSVEVYKFKDALTGDYIDEGREIMLCSSSVYAGQYTDMDNVVAVQGHGYMLNNMHGEAAVRQIGILYYLDREVCFSVYKGAWYMNTDVVWSNAVSSYIGKYMAIQIGDDWIPEDLCTRRPDGIWVYGEAAGENHSPYQIWGSLLTTETQIYG